MKGQGLKAPDFPIEEIDVFGVEGDIMGLIDMERWPYSLQTWSQEGGTFEIKTLYLKNHMLQIEGEGTLTLDDKNQPVMASSVSIQGFEAFLEHAVQQKKLSKGTAQVYALAFKAAQAMSQTQQVEKKSDALRLSLTLQDGQLSLGPVTLGKVPLF